jgi:PAS domain S-box-containing protein
LVLPFIKASDAAERGERTSAPIAQLGDSDVVFENLFKRSADAIWLYDPETGVLWDCNQAAVELMGAKSKEQFLPALPEDISPRLQADGCSTADKKAEVTDIVQREKAHHFEWLIRRLDGKVIPVEATSTAVVIADKTIHIIISRDISERKKAERELLEITQALERRVADRTTALSTSEARLRAMVEHAPEAIVVFDGDSARILFGNQHACDLYGVPMPRLPELSPGDVSPEFQPCGRRSTELAREKMVEALNGGMPVFEWIHRQPNGRLIPTEVRLLRLPAEGQNLLRASIIDNTHRKQAEDALREANHELQKEVEQRKRAEELLNERVRVSSLIANIAVALNAAGGLRAMLQQCAELVVQNLEVAFARVWTLNEATQTLELEASAGCYTHLDGAHSRVKVGEYKIGLIAREKRPLLTNSVQSDPRVSDHAWAVREGMVAFAGYPLLIENRVLGVLAMFSRRTLPDDVLKTLGSVADSLALGIERKRGQNALSESEARFSAAFQASPVFISIFRRSDEKYVLANDALLNWLGCSRDEVLGRTSGELGMWDNLADRDAVWHDLRTIGSIRQKECRWRNRRNQLATVLLSAEIITVAHEPHVLSLVLDITQRKNAEVEILKALSREKELSQLKSNFVSMVSHEFRTPLGIIQSSAGLLSDFYHRMEPDERAAQLASIGSNTRRMAGMMEEILVLSRLDAGKLEFQPVQIDLNSFCRRLVDEILSATNRRCAIELALNSVPQKAWADQRLLGHIFTNLLSNAAKYSEPGATVRFAIEADGSHALCVVQDRGIGIPEEDQEQLFAAFHRGSNVGGRPGTGLGLMLVKRCAELHGGTVHLTSKVGEGTTVSLRLPLFQNSR